MNEDGDDDEGQALRMLEEEGEPEAQELWNLGDASDDEDSPVSDARTNKHAPRGVNSSGPSGVTEQEEGSRLIRDEENDDEHRHRRSISSDATLTRNDAIDQDAFHDDEFGEWNDAGKDYHMMHRTT